MPGRVGWPDKIARHMFTMTNPVRPYAWGSPTVIPDLLCQPPTGEPQAELWLGAHPLASSAVHLTDGSVRLIDAIQQHPEALLGRAVVAAYGPTLPFLLKLLAVDAPLSLQAHPNAAQAAEGFAAEEAAGVPLDAPIRVYRDPAHKPELVCAVTMFEALIGFKPVAATVELLDLLDVPELRPHRDELARSGAAGLRPVLQGLLGFVGVERPHLVESVREAAARRLPETDRFAHELEIVGRLAKAYPSDPGVIISLLLNPLRLTPGEALFVPAGMMHAYLNGVAVEVQANSDNTLRGGLTEKHVAITELLRILDASERPAHRVTPIRRAGVDLYVPPVPEFRLARVQPAETTSRLYGAGPSILFGIEGDLETRTAQAQARLTRGASVFVPAGPSAIEVSGNGVAFWATTNLDSVA
jgi:mannose-6-phosphate isomerase